MHRLNAMMQWITLGMELAGILVIVTGAILACLYFTIESLKQRECSSSYRVLRANLGRSILLGLEFLVAADIISTVAIEPTLNSVAVLAGVVMIRTFLSFALEVEIEGRFPWKRTSQNDSAVATG